MIMFPKSDDTYVEQVSPARKVIIDGINCGDLVEVKRSHSSRKEWMVVLTGRVAQDLFGNADFSTRDHALNYMKAVFAVYSKPQKVFGSAVYSG